MTSPDQITDAEIFQVFAEQGETGSALPAQEVDAVLRDLIEVLWAEPDPDTPPGDQLHAELTELTEFLESERAVGLVAAMQEGLGAYAAGDLAWTQELTQAMHEAAEAVAEELNPDPPRMKLQSTMETKAEQGDPVVLVVGDSERLPGDLEEAFRQADLTPPRFVTMSGGSAAREELAGCRPRLLCLEAPDTDQARAFLEQFRATDPWTPLLLVSPASRGEARRQAIAAGANRVVPQGASPQRLARSLAGLWG
jgi:CheY-like chemotaxis protein